MKWAALVVAILLTMGASGPQLNSLGGAAGGLYVTFALLHIWDKWFEWSVTCRNADDEARRSPTPPPEKP